MKWSPKRVHILGFLIKVTNAGEFSLVQIRERFGTRGYLSVLELRDEGYVSYRKDGNSTLVEITPKGRVAYVEQKKRFELQLPPDEFGPSHPARGVCAKSYVGPRQIISDECRRGLYGGARYSSVGFKEIVDRRPIPASRALEGYRGDNP